MQIETTKKKILPTKDLLCKHFDNKGYISHSLFETLFSNVIHLITGIRNNMKNRLMSFFR